MIRLCPPEKSTQFHYPLDPKKIRAEGSMHKDTTYQGSDRQDFYRQGKKKIIIINKNNKTNKSHPLSDFPVIIDKERLRLYGYVGRVALIF